MLFFKKPGEKPTKEEEPRTIEVYGDPSDEDLQTQVAQANEKFNAEFKITDAPTYSDSDDEQKKDIK